jgi:hypothetical protein
MAGTYEPVRAMTTPVTSGAMTPPMLPAQFMMPTQSATSSSRAQNLGIEMRLPQPMPASDEAAGTRPMPTPFRPAPPDDQEADHEARGDERLRHRRERRAAADQHAGREPAGRFRRREDQEGQSAEQRDSRHRMWRTVLRYDGSTRSRKYQK